VDFLVHAVEEIISAGVPDVLQSMMEGVHAGTGDGGSSEIGFFMDAILTHPGKRRYR